MEEEWIITRKGWGEFPSLIFGEEEGIPAQLQGLPGVLNEFCQVLLLFVLKLPDFLTVLSSTEVLLRKKSKKVGKKAT